MKSEVRENEVHIYGTVLNLKGTPLNGCLVRIHESNSDVEVGSTTTDKYGNYHIILSLDSVSSGYYTLKLFGAGTIPQFKPLGDWENFWLETGSTWNDVIPPDFTLISGVDNV